mmetsp:Transcript_104158/g.335887  ORF Transcript_104158/g.335887 Transcript_104158/m.335887 type:complete len:244 (+) Transcript_104158:792-1523(+)
MSTPSKCLRAHLHDLRVIIRDVAQDVQGSQEDEPLSSDAPCACWPKEGANLPRASARSAVVQVSPEQQHQGLHSACWRRDLRAAVLQHGAHAQDCHGLGRLQDVASNARLASGPIAPAARLTLSRGLLEDTAQHGPGTRLQERLQGGGLPQLLHGLRRPEASAAGAARGVLAQPRPPQHRGHNQRVQGLAQELRCPAGLRGLLRFLAGPPGAGHEHPCAGSVQEAHRGGHRGQSALAGLLQLS